MTQITQFFEKPIIADAILWDFDGTLANSAAKNIAITQQILAQVAPRLTGSNLPRWLKSIDAYHTANHGADHWRDLYSKYFGMTESEILAAEPLWEIYQERDSTEVSLFNGIAEALASLSRFPHGICSANSSGNIKKILNHQEIDTAFQAVVGYEDLPHHQQKPNPDGGLLVLQEIFGLTAENTHDKTVVYIGDHVADAMFARGLAERLNPSNTVISVAVTYSGARPETWSVQPDILIDSPLELIDWY